MLIGNKHFIMAAIPFCQPFLQYVSFFQTIILNVPYSAPQATFFYFGILSKFFDERVLQRYRKLHIATI